MKKYLLPIITLFILSLVVPSMAFAQGIMGENNATVAESSGHTAREEAEGKEVWEKLQAKEIECKDLTDENYSSLGEYHMGQVIGDTERHVAMNQMMLTMMGEEGENQMHIAMGKRMSNCEQDSSISQSMAGGGMMNMMTGGGGIGMMSNFAGDSMGTFGWIFMILFWVLIIVGIVALVKWLADQGKNQGQGKLASDILKERYAKGEIDKKEFEEKKKDLN